MDWEKKNISSKFYTYKFCHLLALRGSVKKCLVVTSNSSVAPAAFFSSVCLNSVSQYNGTMPEIEMLELS